MKEKMVVAPHGSAWEVRTDKSGYCTSLHKTKELAIEAANKEAQKKKTTVIVAAVGRS